MRALLIALGSLVTPVVAFADQPLEPPLGRVMWFLTVTEAGPPSTQHVYTPAQQATPLLAPKPWACSASAIQTSNGRDTGSQSVSVVCTSGPAEVKSIVTCVYGQKPNGKVKRAWVRGDANFFFLGTAGSDAHWSVNLSCAIDSRYDI
jgi:hypothetical protein